MAEDIDIPKVGKFPKKVVIPVAVGAAAFIGWRYWQARQAGSGDDTGTIADGEFGAVDSSIPGVIGAVSPTNSYGSGDTGNTSDGGTDSPGRFTTNAAWSSYVRTQLQGSYDDAAVVGALGNYLGSQPLSSDQQTIVRAAVAVGGYPPVGSFSIISGGNTPIIVAPGNPHVQATTPTTADIAFAPVSGATRYIVYRSGGGSSSVGIGSTSPVRISGLESASTYTMNVSAVSASGAEGPRSSNVTVKTPSLSIGKPAIPTVNSVTKNAVVVSTGPVTNADGYRWYINGAARGYSESPSRMTIGGLSANTSYTVTVQADHARNNPGPVSAPKSVKTAK